MLFRSVGVPAYSSSKVSLRNAPKAIREVLQQSICQHTDEERSGVTCSTCSTEVVDQECRCDDASLRSWVCNDCGQPVDDDDVNDESMDTERSLLLLNLNRRRQS